MSPIKVAICLPIHSGAHPRFVRSLSRMIFHSANAKLQTPDGDPAPLVIDTFVYSTSNVAFSRRMLADEALAWGAHWLLWIDADQSFPPDTLTRLLARQRAIIGAAIRRRDPRKVLSNAYYDGTGSKPVLPKADGIERIHSLGMGVCLTHADVFRKIGQPYFFEEMMADNIHAFGEDVNFCRKAAAAGFATWVDHALSRDVGHMSEIELRFEGDSDR